ncbi:MAG TPA: hypothetical protein VMT74_05350 [Gaiellaceae bacterium]|nr:hypothetical protein [Gaiellaceae bacterium]
MATDVSSDGAVAVDVPPPAAVDAPEPKRQRLYLRRFAVVYLILALALIGTGAGAVIAKYGVSLKHAGPWSSWEPSGSASAKTSEIAQRVGGAYRLPSGHQLLDVYSKKLTVPVSTGSGGQAAIPIAAVAIRGAKGKIDKISVVSDADSRLYQLCGTGTACAIGEGKASIARGQLVRREALELALYTFKYVPGISHVIAFMPPPPGSQPSTLLYFERSDLRSQLSEPLTATIAPKTPLPTTISAAQGARIDEITLPHIYKFALQQTQLGQAVLVLAPNA